MNNSIDFSKSFSYFTEDKNWVSKFVIGAVLGILPIVSFFVTGYMLRIIDSPPQEKNIPEFDNFGEMFKNGFFLFLTLFFYYMPLVIIAGLILALLIPAIVAQKNSVFTTSAFPIFILIGFFALLYLIIYTLTPAITLIFNKNKSLAEAFNIREVLRITKNNFKNIFIIILVFWIINIIAVILSVIPILGILLSIAAHFYITLVVGNLYNQLNKIVYPAEET